MNETVTGWFGPRLDRSRWSLALLVGDVCVIVLHLSYGLLTHGVDPLRTPVHALGTFAPFLIAWIVVAPLVGAYAPGVLGSIRRTATVVVIAWIGAAMLGAVIRSTPLFVGGAPPVFVAVTVGVGLVALLPWRVGALLLSRRYSPIDLDPRH